jgi:hypothetical protein
VYSDTFVGVSIGIIVVFLRREVFYVEYIGCTLIRNFGDRLTGYMASHYR